MTILDTAEIHADVEHWTEFPAEAPPELDLLPLRWALSRIDTFTAKEAKEWLGAVGIVGDSNDCQCAAVARLLVVSLHAVLGESGTAEFLADWDRRKSAPSISGFKLCP